MKYDASYDLKWIGSDHPGIVGLDFTLTNMCALVQVTAGSAVGFTVFQPRDLNATFFKKLVQRAAHLGGQDSHFVLYVPQYIQHRVDVLKPKNLKLDVQITSFLNIKEAQKHFYIRSKMRIVSVDDSPVLLKFLKHCMDEIGYIDVVAQVSDPNQAVEAICKLRPDVVTMDIQMPGKTGVDLVKALLSEELFPVIMVSSLSLDEGSLVFEALNAGAFDYLQKPKLEEKEIFRKLLQEKILLAVENRRSVAKYMAAGPAKKMEEHEVSYPPNLMWCLGASTGGTQALTQVFTSLPTHIPPTLVVQHIPPVYSHAFADSLNKLCPFTVKEAQHGEPVLPDHVYIAPGGMQMGIEMVGVTLRINLQDVDPVNRFKPSVDYLFNEIAKFPRYKLVAGILTGMGRDGSEGLLRLRQMGARTFAQDESTSAVFGMPRAADELGAVEKLVPLGEIARALVTQSMAMLKAS